MRINYRAAASGGAAAGAESRRQRRLVFRKRTGVGRGSDAERAGHLVLLLLLDLGDGRDGLFLALAEEVFGLAARRALRRREHTARQEALVAETLPDEVDDDGDAGERGRRATFD
jgi:hypothetical protein